MSRSIFSFRKSRRYRTCVDSSWAHDMTIKPGDVYARVAYPPHEPGAGWATYILCGECGEHAKEEPFNDLFR